MHVVITGASRGIGAELAARYRTSGDTVTGTSRAGGGPHDLVPLDVTRPGDFATLTARVGAAPVDLLICNAGLYLDEGQSLDTGFPPEMWAETFAANVTGVFLTVQSLLPALRRADGAKIAVISSQMASHTRAPGGSYIYRSSKAAALNLGRNLATDLRPEGIAVGIYHPGWVRTDMGGDEADISVSESVDGLVDRFEALSVATTGCFEAYDGAPYPY